MIFLLTINIKNCSIGMKMTMCSCLPTGSRRYRNTGHHWKWEWMMTTTWKFTACWRQIRCCYHHKEILDSVDDSLDRPPPTAPRYSKTEYDPRLVVACLEIHYIARLKIAHLRTALLLRVAGLWVLLWMFPAMVQQQHNTSEKEYPWHKDQIHTPSVQWLNNINGMKMSDRLK
jgi:hypothetical protein